VEEQPQQHKKAGRVTEEQALQMQVRMNPVALVPQTQAAVVAVAEIMVLAATAATAAAVS
jgi:hypothetical protein